ncbi:MAG TPA: hypothetical protein DCP90_06630 [Clostridiales bacterium]|nr:MAG: hypothetical protein A2Y22_00645 [Clostridiales bacterium GWD2_32_59]HAN10269.1 hypothetical protein [Clostridiales bacterium]
MKSKIKLFNKAIFKSTLKLNMWVPILNFVLLFLMMLMPIMAQKMLLKYEDQDYLGAVKNIINLSNGEFNILVLLIIPVILGAVVTRFMQNKLQNIHIHSMPIEKKQIYTTNVIAGFILLIIPIIINIFGMLLILGPSVFSQCGNEIVSWTYIAFSLEFLIFALTIMVGTLIGSSLMQTIFTYILLVFPVGIYMLIQSTLKIFIIGYAFKESIVESSLAMKLSILPQTFMVESSYLREKNMTENLYLIYILVAIVITIISYFIYKARKVEKTGDIVVFRKLNPILKYGITFCFMIAIGMIVYAIFNESMTHMIVAYAVTSFVAYFLAEMLIRKSVRVLDSYKGYLVYVIVMLIIFAGIKMDITGFENRVPNIGDISKVSYTLISDYSNNVELTTQENKEAVLEIHNIILSEKAHSKMYSRGGSKNYFDIEYVLKNGRKMSRQYTLEYSSETQKEIETIEKVIFASEEYKKQAYEVFDKENINWIGITLYGEEIAHISKKEEIKELIDLMRKDTLLMIYEQRMKESQATEKIKFVNEILIEKHVEQNENYERSTSLYYNDDFKNTKEWLIEHNYYPKS